MTPPTAQPVIVSLQELKDGTVSLETLQKAFGPDSLGILIVKDVPGEFQDLRHRVLSYSSYLGNLPTETLANLENARAKYLTGWSLGKETLRDGQVDTLKGSFYANCAFYVDPSLESARASAAAAAGADPSQGNKTGLRFDEETFPEYLSPNIWPGDADLPGFRPALESLCRLVIDVAVLVAKACDRFAEREIRGYEPGYLERVVATSTTTKARLLHYFPQQQQQQQQQQGTPAGPTPPTSSGDEKPTTGAGDGDDDDWCATHLDHGCLTGLTSAMFVDEASSVPAVSADDTTEVPLLEELLTPPDPAAGLYIRSRVGETVKVSIPRDCLAFQTGEALERITRGKFKAVPHFVRGPKTAGGEGRLVARNTLAVFTQPNLDEIVDAEGCITFGEFARGVVAKNTVGS